MSAIALSTRCASASPARTGWCAPPPQARATHWCSWAPTGRDGIGGASVLASAELAEGEEKRPSVQIGDPFEEKKLMECCLELLDRGLLVSLQDLGAAGLTSSAAEMAAGGGVGLDVALDRVPLREAAMEDYEIMVSESQERMLAVLDPDHVEEMLSVCERWQTGAAVIGEVTETGLLRVTRDGQAVAEVPVSALVDECPLYDLEPERPDGWMYGNRATLAAGAEPDRILGGLLSSPSVASKRWAFEQYDAIVGSRTVRLPESADAAVLRIAESGRAIAVAIDGNGRRVACDPYLGTIEAVLECAQNLACVGAEPLGLTNCLNFGNPEKPHVAWQLERSVQGLADACGASEFRSSEATCRCTTRPRKGRSTRPRSLGWSVSSPTPSGRRERHCARGTRSLSSGPLRPLWPGRSWRSCGVTWAPDCPRPRSSASGQRSSWSGSWSARAR